MDELPRGPLKGYKLIRRIGGGTFGEVWLAYQEVIDRYVAIKILREEHASRPDFIRNFELEAKLVASLTHENIVTLFEYWRDQTGAYLVMRYISGCNLKQLLEQGRLDNQTVEKLLKQLGEALSHAHRKGIVHRDLKPANILVSDEGDLSLTDFGIARPVGAVTDDSDEVSGTLPYMSPSQLRGEPPSTADDIFSLGIILYEMLAGEHPFAESLSAAGRMLMQLLHDPLPNLCLKRPDLPPEINKIIQRATTRNADERYSDARQIAEDFRRMIAVQTQELNPVGTKTEEIPVVQFNPYRGLQPFDEIDVELFFGRQVLTQTLLERLQETDPNSRFLALVGPSGSGKTSVVNAGLIPALRMGEAIPGSDRWFIVQMTPGSQPVQRLAAAMASIASRLPQNLVSDLLHSTESLPALTAAMADDMEGDFLLVIDKLEELFTQVENDADIEHFLRLIHAAVISPDSRLRVIVLLRADFYYRPLLYSGFGEMLLARTQLVPVMTRDEIEQAIVRPAKQAHVEVDTSLVNAIIADLSEEPGMLPLLQYALAETFEHRVNGHMTLETYRRTGGVTGALSSSAEQIYDNLPPDEREITRQIFLNLVRIDEREELAHRRARRADLLSLAPGNPGMVNAVLNTFEERALLMFDNDPATREPTVEVVHEALFANWKTLYEWIETSREDLYIYYALSAATDEWVKTGKDPAFEVVRRRLEDFEALSKRTDLTLTPQTSEFLNTMLAERDRRLLQEADARKRVADLEYRSLVRARLLAAVLLVATVLALILTVFAVNQRDKAERSSLESNSLILAFNSKIELIRYNTSQALALAQSAVKVLPDDPPSAAVTMLTESGYAPGLVNLYKSMFHSGVSALAVSPDGKYALAAARATGDKDPEIYLWAINPGDETPAAKLLTLTGHTGSIYDIAFSPDGTLAASASGDGTVHVWDMNQASAKYGQTIYTFTLPTGSVRTVDISPDGKWLAFGGGNPGSEDNADQAYSLWMYALDTGQLHCQMKGSTSPVLALAFSPDKNSHYLLAGSGDTHDRTQDHLIYVWEWDDSGCRIVTRLPGHTDVIQDIAISPDGKTAVSASADYSLLVWDLTNFTKVKSLDLKSEGHTDWVNKVVISPDGKRVLSGAWDSQLILWDIETGRIINRFVGHGGPINGLAFIRDGDYALSASEDGTVRLWQTVHALYVHDFDAPEPGRLLRIAFTPDHHQAAAGSENGKIYLWNLEKPDATPVIYRGHQNAVYALAFRSDGAYMLSGGSDQQVIRREMNITSPEPVIFGTPELQLNDIPEGMRWVLAIRSLLVQSQGTPPPPSKHTGRVWMVAYSPDGTLGASGGDDGVIIWDTVSGKSIAGNTDIADTYMVLFSPDNRYVMAGGSKTKVYVLELDRATHQLNVVRELDGHIASINTGAFSRDGRYLVTGGYDNGLIVWDMQTYTIAARLQGHTGTLYDADFSADGRYVYSAAGSGDNTVRVWDRATGAELARVNYGTQILSADISVDTNSVLIGSQDTMQLDELPEIDLGKLQTWIDEHRFVPELDCQVSKRLQVDDTECQ